MPRTFKRGADPFAKWKQQTEAAVSTVERISRTAAAGTLHGSKWRDGMFAYYKGRAQALIDSAPTGAVSLKAGFARRLAKV